MHHPRALVVDDSKVGRITMMRLLEPLGLRVDLAESGAEALEYLARGRPDLIFMDHMMPDMDGFEVTRRIKASPETRDIPVIIVSGNDEAAFVQEARQIGALEAIAKPPTSEALERLLATLPPTVAAAPAPVLTLEQVREMVVAMLEDAAARARAEFMAELDGVRAQQAAALDELKARSMDGAALDARLHPLEQRLHGLEARAAEPMPDVAGMLAELDDRLGRRLTDQAGALDELGRRTVDLAPLDSRIDLLGQRLQALEEQAARPLPDVDALGGQLEQRLAAALAQRQPADPAPLLEALRQDLLVRLDERAGQAEARTAGLDSRLEGLAGELNRLLEELKDSRSTLDARVTPLEEAIEAVLVNPPAGDAEMGAAGEEEAAAIRSELAQLRECLSESSLRQLFADAVGGTPPAPSPPAGDPQAELAQLRHKLGRLTTLTLVGGALLLGTVGYLLFLA